MADIIIIAVLLLIIGAAVLYMIKAKKSGTKCIGCPSGGECSHGIEGSHGIKCSHGKDTSSGCSGGCGNCEQKMQSDCCCRAK